MWHYFSGQEEIIFDQPERRVYVMLKIGIMYYLRQISRFCSPLSETPKPIVTFTITANSLFKDLDPYENDTDIPEADPGEELEELSDFLGEAITILIEMNCFHT